MNITDLQQKHQQYKTISNYIENNTLYGISWDGEGDSKKYYSFKDFVDYENILNRINRHKTVNNELVFEIKQRIY